MKGGRAELATAGAIFELALELHQAIAVVRRIVESKSTSNAKRQQSMTLQGVVNNAASIMQSIVGQKPKNQANGAEGAPPITHHQHYPKVY